MLIFFFEKGPDFFCIFGGSSTWRTRCDSWKNPKGRFYLTQIEKKFQKENLLRDRNWPLYLRLKHMIIKILKIILFNCKNWNLFSTLVRWQWCWWHRYIGDLMMVTSLMMVTISRCWWHFSACWCHPNPFVYLLKPSVYHWYLFSEKLSLKIKPS